MQLTDLRNLITEAPDWSPSGEKLAFVSQDRANRQIYVVNAAGGPAAPITAEQGIMSGGGWSRDGRYYYTSTRSGRPEVWKASEGGGPPLQITSQGGVCGFESPRGTFYYWKGDGKLGSLLRRNSDGDTPLPFVPQTVTCRTAPSPKGFYFQSAETSGLWLYDEALERVETVVPHPKQEVSWFTFSPDGSWLAMNSEVKANSDLMIMEHFHW
jgi:Tol biopolymer transport system component